VDSRDFSGKLFVRRTKVFLSSAAFNDKGAAGEESSEGNTIFFDDNGDPTGTGSYVECVENMVWVQKCCGLHLLRLWP
jgi:hypothetical protein